MGSESIKKFLPLAVAAIAGLVAIFLINAYVSQRTEEAKKIEAQRQASIVTVVVATRDIAAGATLNASMLKEEKMYKNVAQRGSANSIDRVADRITMAPIAKGEQVLLNKITISGEESSLAMKIPKGKRAITLSIDNISSVGGMLRPGDHVDIMGVVPIPEKSSEGKSTVQATTMPLFQNVLVLAVGQDFTTEGGKNTGNTSPAITFALTPEEANLVTFVQEQMGRLRLILRSPEDASVQPATMASWDTLLRTVMPQAFQKPVEQPKKAVKSVEIYRGLQKEVRPIE